MDEFTDSIDSNAAIYTDHANICGEKRLTLDLGADLFFLEVGTIVVDTRQFTINYRDGVDVVPFDTVNEIHEIAYTVTMVEYVDDSVDLTPIRTGTFDLQILCPSLYTTEYIDPAPVLDMLISDTVDDAGIVTTARGREQF